MSLEYFHEMNKLKEVTMTAPKRNRGQTTKVILEVGMERMEQHTTFNFYGYLDNYLRVFIFYIRRHLRLKKSALNYIVFVAFMGILKLLQCLLKITLQP